MTNVLKPRLSINRLKELIGFSWARTAPLYAIQKMVIRKSKTIFRIILVLPIKRAWQPPNLNSSGL
ncbi:MULTISPECIES: hypothetical protein [unclassified Allomuricauda]|uniref:hypothetical protein n=1 Tax=unclassified Allomuricauda TaxID=2615049 RepID=UPI00273F9BDA|nr:MULTISPECIES: hypothetical protein [unclassified Allomuricauda]